jgi:uncharacterized protein YbjQ (UPF0145 family)
MSEAYAPHQIPILGTFEPPPGTEIERVLGPCWGITVRSRSFVGTACAGCQQIAGGEITMLTELADSSRNEAMDRLEKHAMEMGANAILAMRFDSSELMQNTNEIVAYGTAVVIRPVARRG